MSTKKITKKSAAKETASKPTAYIGLGRRKSAVARVKLQSGEGNILVNGKPLPEYFTVTAQQITINQPLAATSLQQQIDLQIRSRGGGKRAQAEAARLAIARAILKYDKEHRKALKAAGYLTRDAREKERKKYGLKGARRAPQFSKR
ncbi:30S ribosomal protein S9 [Patescibacteria group bacterium]